MVQTRRPSTLARLRTTQSPCNCGVYRIATLVATFALTPRSTLDANRRPRVPFLLFFEEINFPMSSLPMRRKKDAIVSTKRRMPGGWADPAGLPKGAGGRNLCRWCSLEVPKGRRTFCSDWCVEEWRLRSDPGYLRENVLARDRGVCASCGVDCLAAQRLLKRLRGAARIKFCSIGNCSPARRSSARAFGTPITSFPWWKAAANATSPISELCV